MRSSFQSFTSAYKIRPDSISDSDFVVVRLLYEATRDGGFWNMHWTVTNMPPNSDQVRRQWKLVSAGFSAGSHSPCRVRRTLGALRVPRTIRRAQGDVRVVVPTPQIFLDVTDSFATRKFNPWHQKTIYEYTRHDVADAFQLPKPLFDYFFEQVDRYGGATDSTLQQLRYLREGVFLHDWSPDSAAKDALDRKRAVGPPEDVAAFRNFAAEMGANSN